jgi:hypothetical protein
LPLLLLVLGAAGGAAACDLSADGEASAAAAVLQLTTDDTECRHGSARPATGAPAEGLWAYEDRSTLHRVAAMVGPTQASAGHPHLTRRVETLETRPGSDTIRHASDTASVRLELVPPFGRPAAVYPVSALVRLMAYEPCVSDMREPLIRYLRRDTQGRVITDVLLEREAAP